jgi:anaerobic selenocysteine-containing dehydrogenase
MKRLVKCACPLDCFDACGLLAEVAEGRVVGLKGDPAHPLTRGRICVKGKKLLERLYHSRRLREPLLKTNGRWQAVSWEAAIDLLVSRLGSALRSHGSPSILYYADSGYGGLIKSVDRLFFNGLGRISAPRGSLCWSAGIAAQRYDFGDVHGHAFQDLAHARSILVWGRNPVATNPHGMPFIQAARRQGAFLTVIDPCRTLSAAQADLHLQPRPGTDGALALGMAHHLLATDRIDRGFIAAHTLGFERFRESLRSFTPAHAAGITGLPEDVICRLAEDYADRSPAAIIIGMGLQRYANGGNTVRCIDALAALTGNIGRPGGGVNFANRAIAPWIDRTGGAGSRLPAHPPRTFPLPRLARFLASAEDPPIMVALFAKANPLVQMPDIGALERALARVPFKVVIDMFMTDTARAADLVLPCTSILEEEDLVFSSMFSPYLNYSGQAVAPPEGLLGEYELYRRLARRMGLEGYPDVPARVFLKNALAPLTRQFGVTLETLQAAPFKIPDGDVPWRDGRFRTPSGRFEFYSARARADGGRALPTYTPAHAAPAEYPFRLLTPHHPHAMHSQQFAFRSDPPTAYVHPDDAVRYRLSPGRMVRVASPRGALAARLATDAGLLPGILKIHQGWWHRSGSVNRLTSDTLSDMGENAAYHESFCRIEPLEEDHGGPHR